MLRVPGRKEGARKWKAKFFPTSKNRLLEKNKTKHYWSDSTMELIVFRDNTYCLENATYSDSEYNSAFYVDSEFDMLMFCSPDLRETGRRIGPPKRKELYFKEWDLAYKGYGKRTADTMGFEDLYIRDSSNDSSVMKKKSVTLGATVHLWFTEHPRYQWARVITPYVEEEAPYQNKRGEAPFIWYRKKKDRIENFFKIAETSTTNGGTYNCGETVFKIYRNYNEVYAYSLFAPPDMMSVLRSGSEYDSELYALEYLGFVHNAEVQIYCVPEKEYGFGFYNGTRHPKITPAVYMPGDMHIVGGGIMKHRITPIVGDYSEPTVIDLTDEDSEAVERVVPYSTPPKVKTEEGPIYSCSIMPRTPVARKQAGGAAPGMMSSPNQASGGNSYESTTRIPKKFKIGEKRTTEYKQGFDEWSKKQRGI